VRLAHGIYLFPKIDKKLGLGVLYPSVEEIAKAIAERDKILNKKSLCKVLGISRPTLDKWCEYGFISTEPSSKFWGGYEPFEPGKVLKQLIELKNKNNSI
jgi:hypothetical protein